MKKFKIVALLLVVLLFAAVFLWKQKNSLPTEVDLPVPASSICENKAPPAERGDFYRDNSGKLFRFAETDMDPDYFLSAYLADDPDPGGEDAKPDQIEEPDADRELTEESSVDDRTNATARLLSEYESDAGKFVVLGFHPRAEDLGAELIWILFKPKGCQAVFGRYLMQAYQLAKNAPVWEISDRADALPLMKLRSCFFGQQNCETEGVEENFDLNELLR